MGKVLGIAIIIVTAIGAMLFLTGKEGSETSLSKVTQNFEETLNGSKDNTTLGPEESFPFQEMTVPFLRKQEFKSSLNDLKKYSENPSFTSFLTSYLSENLQVKGLLTIPKGNESSQYPAIVFIHGYIPPTSYQTTQNYASYVNYFAKNGFVVFKIDLRGHGESQGEAGGGYYSSDYVIDTLNAVAALKGASFVNSEKIGLWGHSMAGNIVMRAMASMPEVNASVIWAGAGYTYSDLQQYGIDDNSYRSPDPDSQRAKKRQQLRELYGEFSPTHPFWKQVPATNYLDGLEGSISLHHAVNDNVVSIEYSRNLNSLLDKTQIMHELNEYPAGGHNLTGNTFNQAMQKSVDFFKKHLDN